MIGKLVRTKTDSVYGTKGTWGIIVDEEPDDTCLVDPNIGRSRTGETIYTVYVAPRGSCAGYAVLYREAFQVVEVCSA